MHGANPSVGWLEREIATESEFDASTVACCFSLILCVVRFSEWGYLRVFVTKPTDSMQVEIN